MKVKALCKAGGFPSVSGSCFRQCPPLYAAIKKISCPAGFGIATTTQIEPRLALRDGARGPRERLRIRYDAQGVAREILEQ